MLAGIISISGTDSDRTSVFSRLFNDEIFKDYLSLFQYIIKLKTFFKSNEFRSYSPDGGKNTDWSSPMAICNFVFDTFVNYLIMVIDCFSMLAGNGKTSVSFFAGFDYNQIAQVIYPCLCLNSYTCWS